MQIKTIICRNEDANAFDAEINHWLAEGWRLTKREVLISDSVTARAVDMRLYAELVKMDPAPEPIMEPLEAVQVLARACENAPQCEPDDCPLYDWCTGIPVYVVPKDWKEDTKKQ